MAKVLDKELTPMDAEDWIKFRGESPMQRALVKQGLTPDLIARRLKKELEAQTQKAQVIEVVLDTVDGPRKQHMWTYSEPMIEWGTQQAARRDLVKLWGGQPKEGSFGDDDTPLVVRIKDSKKKED